MNSNYIDEQVKRAFDELTNEASSSELLGEIAIQPRGRHEKTVVRLFKMVLDEQLSGDASVSVEVSRSSPDGNVYRYDIVIEQDAKIVAVVEVKTPFTNHDGVRNKTRKSAHLPKDMRALEVALNMGACATYELITPIGCYPIDPDGEMIVFNHRAVKKNEDAIKDQYKIQWPTRPDYETNPKHGKEEVNLTMAQLASERGLGEERIKGWEKIVLPSPRPNLRAFLDCALYKVQLK